ncbi:hypothetical protein ACFCZT_37265 [Streptomyces sp. NPDC056230]|uniref:hypothetical protein n=1 Tax=Streptomyces sp. NPDC056230 TaxID=3345754 RepID=UPI0035E13119
MTSDNATEVKTGEVIEPQWAKAADGRLVDESVGRARVDGLRLTGEGGLLQHQTKRLESALQGEIAGHLFGIHLDNGSVNFANDAGMALSGAAFVRDVPGSCFVWPARCRTVRNAGP